MAAPSICTNCGYQGKPTTQTKGSIFIEIFLWLLFLLPGLVYSIWRLTTRAQVCPKCRQPQMIPLDTPQGQKLAASFQMEQPAQPEQM